MKNWRRRASTRVLASRPGCITFSIRTLFCPASSAFQNDEGVRNTSGRQPGLVADVEPVGDLATLPSRHADRVQSAEGRGGVVATGVRVVHRQHDEVTLEDHLEAAFGNALRFLESNTCSPMSTPASVKRVAQPAENINPATPRGRDPVRVPVRQPQRFWGYKIGRASLRAPS